jgi:hypothetical protein
MKLLIYYDNFMYVCMYVCMYVYVFQLKIYYLTLWHRIVITL